MSINRTTIVSGPCQIQYDGATFFSKDDVICSALSELDATETDKFGKVDDIILEAAHRVSFVPVGEWESLDKLFYIDAIGYGASVIGGADKPLTIIGSDGERRVYHNAVLTREPNLFLGIGTGGETAFGPIEFTCLRKNNTAWTEENSIVTIDTTTPPSDSAFSRAAILRQPYLWDWSPDALSGLTSENGFRVEITPELSPIQTDDCGTLDLIKTNYQVEAVFAPFGVTSSSQLGYLKHQGAGSIRGGSLNALGGNLDIYATGAYVRVYGAAVIGFESAFSSRNLRNREIRFRATKADSDDPLLFVGTAAPA